MSPSFPPVIDSTMLVAWRSCPRKFFLEFCHNLAPSAVSVDLHFGGAIAAGVEAARRAYFTSNLHAREAEAIGLNTAATFWGQFSSPQGHAKTWHSLLLALDGYFKQWPLDSDSMRPWSPESIEFTFALPIEGTLRPDRNETILYGGRFDMIGKMEGIPWLVDEKTTGRGFAYNWAQSFALRNQFMGYTWACQQYGIPVERVLVRGISVQKTKIDYTQVIAQYPRYLLDRWHKQLVADLNRMSQQFRDLTFDYNFGEACTNFGGCAFLPSCSAKEPSEWFSLYKARDWHPLRKDPTETRAKVMEVEDAIT